MSEASKVDLSYSIAARRLESGVVVPVSGVGLGSLSGDEGYTEVAATAASTNAEFSTRYVMGGSANALVLPAGPVEGGIIVDNSKHSSAIAISGATTITGAFPTPSSSVPAGRTALFYYDGDGWVSSRILYRRMAITSDSLGFSRQLSSSNRLSKERQPLGTFATGESAGGDVNFELLWGALDDFIAAALQGEWSRLSNVKYEAGSDTLTAGEWGARGRTKFSGCTATGTGFDKTGGDFDTTNMGTTGVPLGGLALTSQFVDVTVLSAGGTTEADVMERRIARVATATTDELTFDLAEFDVKSGSVDIILQIPDQVNNGSTYYDMSITRHYSDLGNDRAFFSGQAVNNFGITVNASQGITGSMTLLGTNEKDGTTALAEEVDHQWGSNNTIRGSKDTLEGILEGADGAMTKFCATSIGISFTNNITTTDTTCGPVTSSGQFGATATLAGLYGPKGKSMYQRYLADQDSALFIPMRDDFGRGLAFFLPRGKLSEGQRGTPGSNQNLPTSFNFTAYRDSATERTAIVFSAPKMTLLT